MTVTAGAVNESRTVTVITPENVTVTYQLAGVATRSLALVADLLIQARACMLLLVLAVDVVRQVGFGIDHVVVFLGSIGIFCIMFVYNIFFEMIWGTR